MSNKATLEIRPVKNGYIVYESVGHRHEMTDDARTHVFSKPDRLADFIKEFYTEAKSIDAIKVTNAVGEEYIVGKRNE